MYVGDHGAERKLPFEPEPEINQDGDDRETETDGAIGQEFGGDTRSDDFDAAVLDVGAERAPHFGNGSLLRAFAARLLRDTDQNIGRRAELLQLNVAKPQSAERRPHFGEIGWAGFRLYLDQRAAHKINAEIEPVKEIQCNRQDR